MIEKESIERIAANNKELKIFLPKSHHGIIKDFKSTLQREIEKII